MVRNYIEEIITEFGHVALLGDDEVPAVFGEGFESKELLFAFHGKGVDSYNCFCFCFLFRQVCENFVIPFNNIRKILPWKLLQSQSHVGGIRSQKCLEFL